MASDEKDNDSPTNFVDELRDIQGEYLMLSELYEKERAYGRKLAETMRMLQYEVDVTIPINKEYLSDPMNPLREAYLASESVVVMVDEDDNKTSKPLDRFPPEVILSVIQDCTPELKRLITEKRRSATIKVNSLEKVLRELRKAQATFKQTKVEPDQEPEQERETSAASPAPQPQVVVQQDQRQVAQQQNQKNQNRGREKEEAYAFRASFLEKKEAAENVAKS
jgi:hypothetical protein